MLPLFWSNRNWSTTTFLANSRIYLQNKKNTWTNIFNKMKIQLPIENSPQERERQKKTLCVLYSVELSKDKKWKQGVYLWSFLFFFFLDQEEDETFCNKAVRRRERVAVARKPSPFGWWRRKVVRVQRERKTEPRGLSHMCTLLSHITHWFRAPDTPPPDFYSSFHST